MGFLAKRQEPLRVVFLQLHKVLFTHDVNVGLFKDATA